MHISKCRCRPGSQWNKRAGISKKEELHLGFCSQPQHSVSPVSSSKLLHKMFASYQGGAGSGLGWPPQLMRCWYQR
ncbi:hypothetical protein ILYODFUR_025221 [Ilyodon furcidens]|uniref:Uncharacterized protein n=1 Tax=Ilyodon furcidens TaxID=33524 RepID=A0ABV0T294_9TELE